MKTLNLTDNQKSTDKIYYSNSKELAMLLKVYKQEINSVEWHGSYLSGKEIDNISDAFHWDYLSPDEAYGLLKLVNIPISLQKEVEQTSNKLEKKLVHKRDQKNVLLSPYETFGNSLIFRGFDDWVELDSDHISDHVDGIKIFEIIRQATLASFHINKMKYDTAVALMNLKIQYLKYVETFTPFIIHIIPVNKEDGGAMFTLFNIYQCGKIVASGYLGTYTFRSKNLFSEKRTKMKDEAHQDAKNGNWPVTES